MTNELELKSAEVLEGAALVKALESRGNLGVKMDDDGPCFYKGGGTRLTIATKDAPDVRALAAKRGIEIRDGIEARAVPYIASTEHVDSHGDIVRQNWDFSVFAKNAPMPYSHEWSAPPIGAHIDHRVVTLANEQGGKDRVLYLLGLFADAETSPFADSIFRLVKAGYLPGISVGFRPKMVLDVKDKEERAALGLGRMGLVFQESVLLEASPTTIPANEFALASKTLTQAKRDGLILPKDMLMVREFARVQVYRKAQEDRSAWAAVEANMLQLAKALWPDQRFEMHKDLDVPVTLDPEPTKTDGSNPLSDAVMRDLASMRYELAQARAALESSNRTLSDLTSEFRAALNDARTMPASAGKDQPSGELRSVETDIAALTRKLEAMQPA